MKKVAIILSGCGQHDGSETHEVITLLLSLTQQNMLWDAFAPDIQQHNIVNHLTSQKDTEATSRSVLKESARLVRGQIQALSDLNVQDYDALIIPGGLGAVTVLSNWLENKEDYSFIPEVAKVIDEVITHKKPLGLICIAPVLAVKYYQNAKITIGNDAKLAKYIEGFGCEHVSSSATESVVDEKHNLVTTAANMVAKDISEVYLGINILVERLNDLMNKGKSSE